ncbi:MAG: excisionase [Gracilibacteraceae bacterium]|jgi:hypothetical protein|nr:excisionase [Gracilibacteraceae bacterium]
MECTLMHKNVPVLGLEIDAELGNISKIGDIFDERHLPVGTEMNAGKPNRKSLNDWWTGRSIPASRDGIKGALQSLGEYNTSVLAAKSYGLSLSDQYWLSPKGMGLKWEEVNFFQNDFSKDVGEILFGKVPEDKDNISLVSPDNTSDGWLRKKWIIAEGKRILMKGASNPFQQEPFNEAVASAIMRRLKIAHVEYTLTFEGGKPYSLCENFVTPDTELVPAWRILKSHKKDNRDSHYTHFLRCGEKLEIPGVREAIDKMLTLDYIIANEDRHYNNFGFIRNADTLEWKGFAPVFDSGTSLWYNNLFVGSAVESKPFRNSHDEQIKLVSDLSWYDSGAQGGIREECAEILAHSDLIDAERREKIAEAVALRCKRIEHIRLGDE